MKSVDYPSSFDLYRMAGNPQTLNKNTVIRDYDPLEYPSTGYSCVFDWTCMKYTSVSQSIENILGYNPNSFLEGGLNFALSIIHPADLQKLGDLQRAIFNYYYSTIAVQRAKLRFSYNFRVKRADNVYIHILRQSNFWACDGQGKPAIEIINSTDITGFSYAHDMVLTVHRISDTGIYNLCHEHFFSQSTPTLSSREKQIIELIKKGNTTKQIACKLYLSAETIKSHRKHIIAKTGAVNMAAAINILFK